MLQFNLQLFAHKKGVSSTKNGRDSRSQRLGTKMHDGQIAKCGRAMKRKRIFLTVLILCLVALGGMCVVSCSGSNKVPCPAYKNH